MKEIKVKIPEGCKVNSVSTKILNGMVVVTYEPKDEKFKFGDYMVFDNEEGIVVKGVLKDYAENNSNKEVLNVYNKLIKKLSKNSIITSNKIK